MGAYPDGEPEDDGLGEEEVHGSVEGEGDEFEDCGSLLVCEDFIADPLRGC